MSFKYVMTKTSVETNLPETYIAGTQYYECDAFVMAHFQREPNIAE